MKNTPALHTPGTESFSTINSAKRYDDVYQRERDKLINDADATDAKSVTDKLTGNARGERRASVAIDPTQAPAKRKDSIDDLIIDLNRLYSEQR